MSWKKDSENFLVYLYHLNLSPAHNLGAIAWRNIAEELNEKYQANVTPDDCKEKILDLIFLANVEKKVEGVEILVKEAVFHNIVKERNVTRFSENNLYTTHIPLAAPNQSSEEREVNSSIVPTIIEEASKAREHPQPSCANEIPTSIPSGDQNPTDFQLSVTKGFTEIISKIKQDIGNISEEQTKLDSHKNQRVNLPSQEESPRRFICVREGNEVPAVRDSSNCEYLEHHNTDRAHLSEDALLSTVVRDIEQMEVVSVRKFEEDHEAMEIDQSKFESDFESDSDSDLDSSSGSSSGSDSESESDLDESETESEPEVQVVEIQKKAIDLVDLTAEDDSEIGSDKDLRIVTRDGGKKLVDKKKKVRWNPEYDAFLIELRQSLLRTVNGKERLPNGSWDKIADAMNAQFKVNWITTERCQSRLRRLKALDSSSSQKRKRSSIDSQRKEKKEEKKRARLLESETGVSKGVPWTFRMDYYLMKFRRDLVVETGDLGHHGNLKMLEKMCEKFPDVAAKLSQKNIKSRTKFLKRKIYKDEIREARYLKKGEWNMSHEKRLYEVMKQKYKGDNTGSESEGDEQKKALLVV
eukprot:gene15878-17868_t